MSGQGENNRSPIGPNEVLAIGMGVVALLRIRRRRQREAAERAAAERDRQENNGTAQSDAKRT